MSRYEIHLLCPLPKPLHPTAVRCAMCVGMSRWYSLRVVKANTKKNFLNDVNSSAALALDGVAVAEECDITYTSNTNN